VELLNIVNEVAALKRLSIGQLRQRFAEVFGEATSASNRTWLVKRILWRLQALAEGDLSERARRRAEEFARDADLRLNAPQRRDHINATDPSDVPPEPVNTPAPVDARLRITPAPIADLEERSSVRRVAAIRHRLPRADRRLLDLFLQEGGNYAAVARRLGREPDSVRQRFYGLFRRIRAAL
jgi:DNA-directed RNA polymerase specialized sigma24 family protein